MSKIVDSFLFFQELDLLEIRLQYLDPYVDLFIISEAGQTFSGLPKSFLFEENQDRFTKFLPKIRYQKIIDTHQSYDSVISHLANLSTPSARVVYEILQAHTHYPKSKLHWVLDTYHRESLHIAYEKYVDADDFLFFSDLDEIPSSLVFSSKNLEKLDQLLLVCQQDEFRYFLNYYKDSDWLGTIGSKYNNIKAKSLNSLRMDSKSKRSIIDETPIIKGGWHFTSCGGISAIRKKIEGWGHQEFNNSTVLDNLEKNIAQGKDIFYRDVGQNLKIVSTDDQRFFDESMSKLLGNYPALIADNINRFERSSKWGDYLAIFCLNLRKIREKLFKR
jgi:beta-1,4-mannosyl-glycoprotein beta-1,4-N-acetylglucosaminyltransferase